MPAVSARSLSAFTRAALGGRRLVAPFQPAIFWLLLMLELFFAHLAIVHFKKHARCRHECVLDAVARLRRRLEEPVQAFLSCKLLALGRGHLALLFFVFLVGDEEDQCVRVRLILYLIKPALKVHVRVHARQVVCEEHSVRTTVEYFSDRLEALLACRVPDLQLEGQVLHADKQGAELDAHGHLVVLRELVVAHAVHQARLADA